jgi:Tol biopolymer transport system component
VFTVRDSTQQPMVILPSDVCNDGAFGTPSLIWPGVDEDDFGPSLSADRLTLLFARVLDGRQQLFTATRDFVDAPFRSPSHLDEIPSGNSTTPVLSSDGLQLYFASDMSGDWEIWGASRLEVTSRFGDLKSLVSVNSRASDLRPWLDASELNLYFESDRNTTTGLDIWRATRRSASEDFDNPMQVAGMAEVGVEGSPSLTPDGLTLFYLADAGMTSATRRLYQASRAADAEPFSRREVVPVLDSFDMTGHAFLSADGRELVFSAPYQGRQRLWNAVRGCD